MSTKAFKSEKIDAMKEKFEKAQVAVVTEYKGYSVDEITTLRRNLQKEGGDYMVTKNTLAKIAAKGTAYEAISDLCRGPIAIAFGFEDQVSPAKVVSKFIKDSKKGEILGAVLEGNMLSADEAKALANLPSKEELYAKMLGSINSPASGIVGSVNAVMASLTRAIAAVRDQKAA
ncbi:TPA: 50S ribosomal protein L10 [Candidatus Scatousia excrementigallinarum]|uniref:Large ribosomal subunit protein uL10 n=1 Tax=Candidatus Scatousia excrementigallinarum TaxID=2840935 RepID=A0A9D1EZ73_9BACT|nr:50S ribosomal protein L10 [Candidatus Scatousia excrementigallinarum]